MLELVNIHKSFTHNGLVINVLRGIDLVVPQGASLAITGASGVGKSTLLNVMGTLEPPTQGSVTFENRNVYAMNEAELCRLRNNTIGFVFQFHHLLPEFNALENTLMPALIARLNRKEATKMAERILSKMGLEKRLKHRIGELSGGEQQRVAIARALIMKPKLLLADEPTGNLDMATGEEIADLLVKLNEEEDLTLVIATHNQSLAKKMSSQVEILDGRIKQSGL
ncbi:MAG: ABC transporter ATP-binding protein [Deltaproteobacteria bacterium]|nr:ABC transporter ATP-binding protein [Deltaproteobacteria bacterium]MBW1919091.1 ABC transporter ATP-binding protein [Deltaproteobacteria bacterium]MBW1935908.1 ABC transporter ATP-binding protein [Deltaproteobacteria bacterium]MBW1977803.1 ABC transporter ATP-binding protein [Deltaproteobacteria bacterium]MBW2044385.1 ABC transporter ATP-binding protein [Deltaproteobacteria bacterium]